MRRRKVGCGLALAIASVGFANAEPTPKAAPSAGDEVSVEACPNTSDTLARVQERYDSIQDLTAAFEQETQAVLLAQALAQGAETSRGTVVLSKPGRMRWDYREPETSLVLSDGETLWVYDPAAGQVTRMPMDGDYLAGAALQFLFGAGKLGETFAAETLGCEPGGVEIGLVPLEAASFERLSLTARSEDGLISETSIVDLFGNRTTIRFSGIALNTSPDPELFRFAPPEGVEVLDLSREP